MKWIKLYEDFEDDDGIDYALEEEILDLFATMIDEDFEVTVNTKIYFPSRVGKPSDLNQSILSDKEYFKGMMIDIKRPERFTGDLTLEFKSIISQIIGNGYKLFTMDPLGIYNRFTRSSHIDIDSIKINNELVDGAMQLKTQKDSHSYYPINNIRVYLSSDVKISFSPKELAIFYNWRNYIEKDDTIWIEIEEGELAGLFIPDNSDYYGYLVDGKFPPYHLEYYRPKISELSNILNKECLSKLVDYILQNTDTMERFIEENDLSKDSLTISKSQFKDIILSPRTYYLSKFLKFSYDEDHDITKLIDNIIMTIGDRFSIDHRETNKKEINEAFQRLLKKYNISFEKSDPIFIMVSGDDDINHINYKIKYNDDWIVDTPLDLDEMSLKSVFKDWVSDTIGTVDLNVRLSDYGDTDYNELSNDIISEYF